MKGKSRFILGVVVMAILALALVAIAQAQEKTITWKMAGFWGPGDAAYLPETFAKQVTEKSGGRLKVITYPAGQLYGVPEVFGALQKGLIQACQVATGWWSGTIPLYRLPDMPFLLKENSELRAWLEGGLWEMYQREAEKAGFKLLITYGWAGLQCFSIYPVRTLEDAKGHKWRVHTPQLAMAVKEIGGTPASVPMHEVYQALQRGVIDAAFGGVVWVYSYRWHEVAKYVTKFDLGLPPEGIFVNKKAFDDLPPDLKDIVIKASQHVQSISWDTIEGFINKKWKAFKEEGCTINVLAASDRKKAEAMVRHIWTEEAGKVGPVGVEALQLYYKIFPDRKP